MNIALLAFDLDGTTITQHQYLPQENRLALEDAAAQGILLVPRLWPDEGLPPDGNHLPAGGALRHHRQRRRRLRLGHRGSGVAALIPMKRPGRSRRCWRSTTCLWSTTARARPPPARATRSVPSPTSACRRASVTSWIRTTAWCPALGGPPPGERPPAGENQPALSCLPRPCARRSGSAGGPGRPGPHLLHPGQHRGQRPRRRQGQRPGGPWRSALGIPREKVMAPGRQRQRRDHAPIRRRCPWPWGTAPQRPKPPPGSSPPPTTRTAWPRPSGSTPSRKQQK